MRLVIAEKSGKKASTGHTRFWLQTEKALRFRWLKTLSKTADFLCADLNLSGPGKSTMPTL